MSKQREEFLRYVRLYVEKDPEVAPLVTSFVQEGLTSALREVRERACDMEVALSVLATHRYKGKDAVVKDKLSKWSGKSSLNWDWLIGE